MILRTLSTALIFGGLFASLAPAQTTRAFQPLSAPLRSAGTFHVATGTWTRGASSAALGSQVVFDNTCPAASFVPLAGSTFTDEGRLPAPESPVIAGCNHAYAISGFEFAYCSDQATTGLDLKFYPSYQPCTDPTGLTPVFSFPFSGLPGSASPGSLSCWMLTVDLVGPGTVTYEFVLPAEGGGAPGSTTDHFGWSMRSLGGPGTVGPILAGDPSVCLPGAGTIFDPAHAGPGTGLGSTDGYYLVSGGGPPDGCYPLGGSGFASFHLKLYSDACLPTGIVICPGDGAGAHTPCPCGNNSAPAAAAGCLNSLGQGGTLRALGVASVATDTLSLRVENAPDGSCIYFQGSTLENGGNGITFGDGLRCAGGSIARLKLVTNTGGGSRYPLSGDPSISHLGFVTFPATRYYQAYYHDVATFCAPRAFNLTNALEIFWGF